MSDLFNNYLQDLVYLIKENYNDVITTSETANEIDKTFYQGQELAYYSVLSLIEHQLIVFDGQNQLIGKIVPQIGKKAEL